MLDDIFLTGRWGFIKEHFTIFYHFFAGFTKVFMGISICNLICCLELKSATTSSDKNLKSDTLRMSNLKTYIQIAIYSIKKSTTSNAIAKKLYITENQKKNKFFI